MKDVTSEMSFTELNIKTLLMYNYPKVVMQSLYGVSYAGSRGPEHP